MICYFKKVGFKILFKSAQTITVFEVFGEFVPFSWGSVINVGTPQGQNIKMMTKVHTNQPSMYQLIPY
jgi:hypothetical protein